MRMTVLVGVIVAAVLMACDSQDKSAATATATPTSQSTAAPQTPTATPTGVTGGARQTGIADVDAILGAIAARNVDALLARIALQEMACIDARIQGAGGPVRCAAGETVGSKVKAFPTSTCEGEWTREPDLRAMVVQWLDGVDLSRGVYSVVRGPSIARSEPYWPVGEYWAIYQTKGPTTGPGRAGGAKVAVIEAGKLVALRFGCSLTPAEEMTFRGSALPVVLSALP